MNLVLQFTWENLKFGIYVELEFEMDLLVRLRIVQMQAKKHIIHAAKKDGKK